MDKVYFRLRMRDESQENYQAAKEAWMASMRRCGLKPG